MSTEYLSPRLAAAALGVSLSTFQRWRTAGVRGVRLLPERTLGVRVLFTLAGIQRWQDEVDRAKTRLAAPRPESQTAERRRLNAEAARCSAEIAHRERMRTAGVPL